MNIRTMHAMRDNFNGANIFSIYKNTGYTLK